ncbi:GlsB/YeaQ/YmgE family stress response membrane protein [Mycobacterium kansasii]|uniref:Transglycosylase n=3 Tax=Mycobacterium kansasii TaxID=1768 RepID=A0A1V3X223_MYCKA|nr:GlsB/YeaQ/YmgE family stress response membrane protein [Mycobacterium kansasii]EUA05373.1 transglycosylase associated family protein [Mycobacterium kansasii 824]AGZ51107.1 transglycosylase [Mycobacterium kansasii ATCC 12478]ARG57116.1 transglycosylase [Mycobacterium kansasii]ARG62638.1 transglycosylase [Mycobacterium kansasii]ARG70259.1 transglycosylase [Mycobacterium kansasii]
MIGTIIGAIVVGLIVGALARLVMPGKQNIGVIMTVVLGAVGSFLGTWISYKFGYSNQNGGFEFIPFLVGIVVAVLLIAAYLGLTGRRGTSARTGPRAGL